MVKNEQVAQFAKERLTQCAQQVSVNADFSDVTLGKFMDGICCAFSLAMTVVM